MATDFSSGNINAYLVKDEYNQYAVRIETDVKSLDTVKGINRSRRCTFSPRITWYIPEDLHYSKNVSKQVIESVLERELLKPSRQNHQHDLHDRLRRIGTVKRKK